MHQCESKAESDDGTAHSAATIAVSDLNTVGTFDPKSIESECIQLDDEKTRQARLDALILHQENPDLTYAECFRFRNIRTMKKARRKLKLYREWQKKYVDDIPMESLTFDNEKEVWEYAASHACRFFPGVEINKKLPRVARIIGEDPDQNLQHEHVKNFPTDSVSQRRILHFLPMLFDSSIAPLEFYSLAFAIYFYIMMDRNSLEDVNVVCDARHGQGWTNPSPISLVPFAKTTSKHMDFFPQRLHKLYAYPVPLPAKLIWGGVKRFLKPIVVAKINIFWGNSSIDASPPDCFREEFFAESTMDNLESERRSEFH